MAKQASSSLHLIRLKDWLNYSFQCGIPCLSTIHPKTWDGRDFRSRKRESFREVIGAFGEKGGSFDPGLGLELFDSLESNTFVSPAVTDSPMAAANSYMDLLYCLIFCVRLAAVLLSCFIVLGDS
jgi:hypothetical protein